jgi:hypothetical protein
MLEDIKEITKHFGFKVEASNLVRAEEEGEEYDNEHSRVNNVIKQEGLNDVMRYAFGPGTSHARESINLQKALLHEAQRDTRIAELVTTIALKIRILD